MNDTASSPSSVAFADASSGYKYFDDDAHYQSLALGVVGELDQNIGLILLTGSPPPDSALFARHLERECAPKRYVRTIHGGTVTSVVSLVVAAGPSAVLVIDPPADIAGEILQQLSCGPSSDDHCRAAVVLLGPDSLARGLRAPGSKGGKWAMPAWMRFHHLARHEVEPFIRFQMNEAHLDQAIFKAPLISLIESYADGDPAVVNRLADEIMTATQGTPPGSFADVVADLTKQIGGDIRGASVEASPSSAQVPAAQSADGDSIAPVPAVESTAEPLETKNDSPVSAGVVAPPEMASEATGSSLSIAGDGTVSIPVVEPAVESHRLVAPEDDELGSRDGGAMQDQVTSAIVTGADELLTASLAEMPVTSGSAEGHSGSSTPIGEPPAGSLESRPAEALYPAAGQSIGVTEEEGRTLAEPPAARSDDGPIGTPPAEGSAELSRSDPAHHVPDDERALSPVPPAASPEEATFPWQASASAANAAKEAASEIAPEADALEPVPVDSNLLPSVASLARPDELLEPSQVKSRTVGLRRKWLVPTGVAASIVIAFGAASVSPRDVGPAIFAWLVHAKDIVSNVKLALAPAPDGGRGPVLVGSSEQRHAAGERSDAPVSQPVNIGSLSEASGGDRGESRMAAAEPNVAAHSPSKASGDRREQPMAAAPLAEPNGAGHSPSQASGDRPEQPVAAAPPAEPNGTAHSPSKASGDRQEQPVAAAPPAAHSPSARGGVAAQAPTQETPAPQTATVVAPSGSPTQDPVIVAARSQPPPLPTPPIAKAVVPSPAAALFLQRGDQLMAQGDIVPARHFFERAAEGGVAGAAIRLAKSYDPIYLRRAGVRGVAGDTAKATQWYEKAIASGDVEAELGLLQLRANTP